MADSLICANVGRSLVAASPFKTEEAAKQIVRKSNGEKEWTSERRKLHTLAENEVLHVVFGDVPRLRRKLRTV